MSREFSNTHRNGFNLIWNKNDLELKTKGWINILQFTDGIICYHRSEFVCKRKASGCVDSVCRWQGSFRFLRHSVLLTSPSKSYTYYLRALVSVAESRLVMQHRLRRMHFSFSEHGKWIVLNSGARAGEGRRVELSKTSIVFVFLAKSHTNHSRKQLNIIIVRPPIYRIALCHSEVKTLKRSRFY